jgi:hypothetical protein
MSKSLLIDDSMEALRMTRLKKAATYRDQSTICIMPSRDGTIHMRVANSWFNLVAPMNQKFYRLPVVNMEVGAAYSASIEQVLAHPSLKDFKYVLTLESDNIPPPDGLLKLIENMDEVDVCGGLYWTKGELGQPMIYGDPNVVPLNFWPQVPLQEQLQRCNGLGMGFTLFKLDIFRDERLTKPWFKTIQDMEPGKGMGMYTQDLYFFEKAVGLGYKIACDTRVKVGHYDESQDIIW